MSTSHFIYTIQLYKYSERSYSSVTRSMRNSIAYQLTPSCLCSVRLWGGTSQYKNSGWSECPSWVMALAGERTLSIISHLWRHPHQWPVGAHSSPLHYNVRYTLCFILYCTFLLETYVGTLCSNSVF